MSTRPYPRINPTVACPHPSTFSRFLHRIALRILLIPSLLISILALSSPVAAQVNTMAVTAPRNVHRVSPQADVTPVPLMFIRNDGQYDPSVKFEMNGNGGSVVFTDNSILIAIEKPGTNPPWVVEGDAQGGTSPTPTPPLASEETGVVPELSVVEIQFNGVNATPQISGENNLTTHISFFLGNDPSAWQTDVPAYTEIRYSDFAQGYDLVISGESGTWAWKLESNGNTQGRFDSGETQQISAKSKAEGDPALPDLSLEVDGGQVGLQGDSIVIGTDAGNITLPLIQVPSDTQPDTPSVEGNVVDSPFTDAGAEATPASPIQYKGNGSNGRDSFWTKAAQFFGLEGSGSDNGIIVATGQSQNPGDEAGGLVFSSFLGGAMDDQARDITYGSDGSMYITGSTMGWHTWPGVPPTCKGICYQPDIFVTKINAQRQMVYLTIIGGTGTYEDSSAITVDEYGNAYIVGYTSSNNFPMNAVHTPYKNYNIICPGTLNSYATDIILFKLNSLGNSLLYSTYLGGKFWEFGYDIAYDPGSNGKVYIVGDSDSPDFPPFKNSSSTVEKDPDGVLAGFDTNQDGTASLLTIQFFGGPTSHEQAHGVAISPVDHSLWIIGQTTPLSGPASFQTVNGFDNNPGGGFDAYIVHLSPASGYAIQSSSFFGGSGKDCERDGSYRECDIAVDAAGNAYITGTTQSTDLAQRYTQGGGFQPYGGAEDIFAAKMHGEPCEGNVQAECMKLDYWRYLGGAAGDTAFSIVVSAAGDAYITGQTGSYNFGRDSFPDALVPDNTIVSGEAYLVRLAPTGYISYFTYLGGNGNERAYGVALLEGEKKAAIVGGFPQELGGTFPLVNAVDSSAGTTWEGFISEFAVPDWERRALVVTSPTEWVMALSLRPTFTWKPAPGTDQYRLEIHRVNAQKEEIEEIYRSVVLPADDKTCPPSKETCTFKLTPPSTGDKDLTSGPTIETGGYAWRIISEDIYGNMMARSEYGYFQIPSLGGTWEEAVAAGLCSDANCIMEGNPPKPKANPTWPVYDDKIYIEAEREDVPLSILKAIMIGETVFAIAPIPIGSTTYPPNEAYGYEPGEDCEFFVKHSHNDVFNDDLLRDFSINILGQGENPPWDTPCQYGQCTAPYDLDGMDLRMSIYDFAIGRNFNIANKKPFIGDDIPGCYTHDNPAQYRTSAGYGLGMITYIHEYLDLYDHAKEYYGGSAPRHVPPEYLYDPEFNIFLMGKVLNDKRCTCDDPISAYTNTNLDDWLKPVSSYNGWGNCEYGRMVIRRAKNFTSPKTLIPGVNTFLREYTSHIDGEYMDHGQTCAKYNSCAANKANTTAIKASLNKMYSVQKENYDPQIFYTKHVDLKGSLGTVWVELVIAQEEVNIGWVRIYRDEGGTELLWQSDPISDINAASWINSVDYNGATVILTYWGDGAHATRVFPIIWDGMSFQEVLARDEGGTPVFIGGDGGAIIPYTDGYLAAYWRNISPPAYSYEAIIWEFNGSEYRIVRRFISPPIGSDQIIPESSIVVNGKTGVNGWYTSGVEAVIAATDNQAVKSIYYYIKNGRATEEKTIPMDKWTIPLYEGRWEIKYQATDASDNQGEKNTEQVLIDGTPPTVEYRIGDTDGSQDWYPAGTVIEFEASDPYLTDGSEGSGVGSIEYSVDQEEEWRIYEEPFTLEGEGRHQIKYRGTDQAGNVSETRSISFGIDQSPPETDYEITGCPKQRDFYNCPIQLDVTATDYTLPDGSQPAGVDRIEYRIQGSDTWITYTEPLEFTTSGRFPIEFRSFDKAGNVEPLRDFIIQLDLEFPVSSINILGQPDAGGRYPPGTQVVITAMDPSLADGKDGSGVDYLEYSLDSTDAWTRYGDPIVLQMEGVHTIYYRAIDVAGNVEQTQSIQVEIGSTADTNSPALDVFADPLELWPPNNKLVPVRIFGTAADIGSGIKSIHIEVVDEYGTCQPTVVDIGMGEIVDGNWERTIQLEASRKGNDKDGRKYTIRVTATDNAGNMTTKDTVVIVPHDQGH